MSNWPRLLAALAAAALAGFAVFAFVVVMGYGVMWLFIYGDSTLFQNFSNLGFQHNVGWRLVNQFSWHS